MTTVELSKSNSSVQRIEIHRMDSGVESSAQDVLAVEEPLEIRVDFPVAGARAEKSVSITMRTPGHDAELAVGFLFTEGLITERAEILEYKHCGPPQPHLGHSNVLKVKVEPHDQFQLKSLERNFYTTSSCGVCGKASIDALKTQNKYTRQLDGDELRIDRRIIPTLPDRLRAAQEVFDATGGLHASGLFSATGDLIVLREDVGRHNALDKVIGWALLEDRLPLKDQILLVSGRVSFELVQKASMAGLRCIAAVGAPSSLALELAREMGMTLIGFVRQSRFNIYHGDGRIE